MGLVVRKEIGFKMTENQKDGDKDKDGDDSFEGTAGNHFKPLRLKMAQTSAKRAVWHGE